MKWESVIGLEVHVQLSTLSKLFSGAATQFGAEPNTQACAIDLGLPGVLPVLNKKAVELAVRFGLSVQATIAQRSVFARKNYFYPDLPKGYQISQFDLPIVQHGFLDIEDEQGNTKRIRIERAHLEEDAGKSIHENLFGYTGLDLNRAGTPLLEIVSAPDLRSPEEAVSYLKTLHNLVRYIEISDANMQEGSFRCDVNISIRPHGSQTLNTRTEIKNLNSFRFIERAIIREMERQIDCVESGGVIRQETRLYDPDKDETRPMRSKEEAHDYRYFPDPDLLPLVLADDLIESVKTSIPELPWDKKIRFQTQYGLNDYDAKLLCQTKEMAQYFEDVLQTSDNLTAKLVANWMGGEISASLNKANLEITQCPISPNALAELLICVVDQTISGSIAKTVFEAMWNGEGNALDIIEEKGLKQISDVSALEAIVDKIIAGFPEQTAQYRAGQERLFGFFVGQVMKASGGKANPQQVNELLKQKLQ